MSIVPWPIVGRSQLIQSFRPGEAPTREAPFRTLRAHQWATSGVNVVTRGARHASGRFTVFSVLNLSAARLARNGDHQGARAMAKAAERIEGSAPFNRLKDLLSGKSVNQVSAAVAGHVSGIEWPELLEAVRDVAHATRRERPAQRADRSTLVTGRILEVREDSLVLAASSGERTLVPRWLGEAAHRTRLGEPLALITDHLNDNQMVVQAFPALDLAKPVATPFGRAAPVRTLTAADARLLSRKPVPLRPLLPVVIEA
jgi:hypothetical protein